MTETPEKKPKTKGSKKRPILWGLVVLLVGGIGIGTFYAGPHVQDYMSQLKHPIPAPDILPIPEKMISADACEEQRIILLESQQEIKQACDADISLLHAENKKLQEELTSLREQIEVLRNAPQKETTDEALRLTDLLRQIERGKPFASFLSDMKKASPKNQLLKKIETELGYAAAVGIPTTAQIQASFKEDFNRYEEALFLPRENEQAWYNIVWMKLRTLIRVRPLVIRGNKLCPRMLLYKASDEIAGGQLGLALVTLRQMPEKQQFIFTPLTKQIESRLKAEKLLSMTGENQ